MEWQSTGCQRQEDQYTGLVAWHAGKAPIHEGAGAAGKEWVSWRGAIRRPRTPELRAAQPRLRELGVHASIQSMTKALLQTWFCGTAISLCYPEHG